MTRPRRHGEIADTDAFGPFDRVAGVLSVGGVFDGIGLLAYGLHLAGLEHRWLCEVDPWRRDILARRFPDAVLYDDVRAVGHGAGWVDVIAGGFPCKGASTLGKLEGFGHPETVLWREMRRAVGELGPRYVVVENVSNLLALHDGAVWGEVLGDLASLGFDVVWDCLPAAAVGAPHGRDRVFAVATHTDRARADAHPAAGSSRPTVGERARAVAHAVGAHEGRDGGQRSEQAGRPDAARGAGAAADSGGERRQQVPGGAHGDEAPDARRREDDDHEPVGARSGVVPTAVEWGEYEPAIRRWEAIAGPAPEPLLRGVDARGTRRVERSRLSALGDGVQVQVGYLAGRHIIELEEGRLAA